MFSCRGITNNYYNDRIGNFLFFSYDNNSFLSVDNFGGSEYRMVLVHATPVLRGRLKKITTEKNRKNRQKKKIVLLGYVLNNVHTGIVFVFGGTPKRFKLFGFHKFAKNRPF